MNEGIVHNGDQSESPCAYCLSTQMIFMQRHSPTTVWLKE